jgi:putative radical SAM enzyme (TIGR03279 family)
MKIGNKGLRIASVKPRSPAFKAGLRKGDIVVSVDGNGVSDSLEFGFFSAQPLTEIQTIRGSAKICRIMHRPNGKSPGVLFNEVPIKKCGNKCIFCFIDQMPRGLRKSLYVKDEDYRHSFANGNYITLSHTSFSRLGRIAELGLSPLYISVHATDQLVRGNMLGNSRAFDIMSQLRFLAGHGIRCHTQIVVCPGINDGGVLKQTIRDLLTLNDGLLSIAVVPVGLTRHRSIPLTAVDGQEAMRICQDVAIVSDRRLVTDGKRRIFCADELFLKAKLPIPEQKYYEDYPQIENGVGLIRQLLEDWRRIKKHLVLNADNFNQTKQNKSFDRCLVITSLSAYLYFKKIIDELQTLCMTTTIDVAAVRNLFFGETVTVAGLMTARDVIRTAKSMKADYQCILLPTVMFNTRGYTLDGYSVERIEKSLGLHVKAVSDISEVLHALGY